MVLAQLLAFVNAKALDYAAMAALPDYEEAETDFVENEFCDSFDDDETEVF